nr:MAG TPA: hypothetical protein [Caudoviricetes sp.]
MRETCFYCKHANFQLSIRTAKRIWKRPSGISKTKSETGR